MASHCKQRGLRGAVICRKGWRRGSSQITLGFLIRFYVTLSPTECRLLIARWRKSIFEQRRFVGFGINDRRSQR